MADTTLYYKSGEVLYIGSVQKDKTNGQKFDFGTVYRKDGTVLAEGVFQRGGLRRGKWYYPNGQLMFSGEYNARDGAEGRYYGPPYPKEGQFFSEAGILVYDGKIPVCHCGGVGYPSIRLPNGLFPVPGIPTELG